MASSMKPPIEGLPVEGLQQPGNKGKVGPSKGADFKQALQDTAPADKAAGATEAAQATGVQKTQEVRSPQQIANALKTGQITRSEAENLLIAKQLEASKLPPAQLEKLEAHLRDALQNGGLAAMLDAATKA